MGEGFVGEEGSELENYGRSEQAMPSVARGRAVGGVSTFGDGGWEVRVTPEHPLV